MANLDSITVKSPCPLCEGTDVAAFAWVNGRSYLECRVCRLVFLLPAERPGAGEERARYEEHRNDPQDPSYRAFLDRLCAPLVERLAPGARGLDYGSGPGPTLSVMLEERGFPTEVYDPYFAPDPAVLRRTYDFVTCTETVEHFFAPGREFSTLGGLLRPGGLLAVMTEVLEGQRFEEWHYVRDPTHVAFYRDSTLRWIAGAHGWDLERPHRNVALFRKGEGATGTHLPRERILSHRDADRR